jgi:hypothetical protein
MTNISGHAADLDRWLAPFLDVIGRRTDQFPSHSPSLPVVRRGILTGCSRTSPCRSDVRSADTCRFLPPPPL